MIEIITQPNGWSAEEVERYLTVPLENALNGMIDLDHIRSQSLFGLSDVKCYFTWDVAYHLAQQRVLNRLNFVTLPPGVTPQAALDAALGGAASRGRQARRINGPGFTWRVTWNQTGQPRPPGAVNRFANRASRPSGCDRLTTW